MLTVVILTVFILTVVAPVCAAKNVNEILTFSGERKKMQFFNGLLRQSAEANITKPQYQK
jgi:hypothetical protein